MTRTAASLATGPFGHDWPSVAVKHLAVFQSGSAIDGEEIEDFGTYPVYGGNGLRGYTERSTHRGEFVLVGRQGALCGNINYAEGRFWASEHALVGHPRRMFHRQWFGEVLRTANLGQFSTAAAQPGIAAEVVNNLRIPVPPVEIQRLIARFLERETGRIDGLIEKKTRFIALLKEKRAAVITHAVTKGFDPDAPMKDSGQDWLDRVPAHWEVIAAARLFVERDERSKTGDEELLTVSHLTGVTPRSEKTVHMIEAESTIGYKRCLPGDLVVNTLWAWMGAMGTAPILGIASPAYNVYTPKAKLIDPRYIDYIVRLQIFAKEVTRFSKGVWSSRLRLYPEGLREVRFPVPPLDEQARIADHLDIETARIDGLIALTERSIDLLREKRAALITAAAACRR